MLSRILKKTTKIFLSFANLFVLLGLIILYPFESVLKILSKLLKMFFLKQKSPLLSLKTRSKKVYKKLKRIVRKEVKRAVVFSKTSKRKAIRLRRAGVRSAKKAVQSFQKLNYAKKLKHIRLFFQSKLAKNRPARPNSQKIDKKSFLKFRFPLINRIRQLILSANIKGSKFMNNLSLRTRGLNTLYLKAKYFFLGVMATLVLVLAPMQIYGWYRQLPRPELLAQTQNRSTKILDRRGRLLYEIYVDRKFEPVALDEIPQHAIDATLAVEDSEFFEHNGIRPISMIRAAKATLVNDQLQGGSTITQQLVKNVLLTPERTISRKLKEIFISLLVERQYTKNQILELYLNNIAYGGTAWGIQSASQKYFGKDVSQLTLAESSFLAGLPSAPSIYSPFSAEDGEKKSKERQELVLGRMVELGYITQETADETYNQKLSFATQAEYIRAPHFVNYVRNQLDSIYGKRHVDFGGLTVVTTLDLDIHEKVQQIVTEEVDKGAYLNFSNGASLVLDTKTGEILAYVGSTDYFSDDDGKFDIITAFRQPGSSIKPVTYALALSSGYTPASIIDDSPLTISFYNQTYSPVNYDGKFHGKVTLRQALANSYNIPAVKLVRNLGVEKMVELANKMGLKNWKFDNSFGYSVTLGGKEVRLLDLTNVYATLARGGVYEETTPIISVKDSNGFSIFTDSREKEVVLGEDVSYIISNILSDNRTRSEAFGSGSYLEIPKHTVAVKTGTTDEKRDNLTLGYTPTYVVGVWVGNNDNTPMNPYLSSGLSGASPIWNRIMRELLSEKKNESFVRPKNIFVKIDEECDNRSEYFISGTAPKHLCDVEKLKNDKEKSKKDERR